MNRFGLVKTIIGCKLARLFTSKNNYQIKQLSKLLQYAKDNSKFYAELYRDINLEYITPSNLSELPPVTKAQLVENYDRWVCDSNITKDDVAHFLSDMSNIDKMFLDKYIIDSTSGTTGEKLSVISSKKEFNYMAAVGLTHTWPKNSYVIDIITSNRPVVYILSTGGFYTSLILANSYLCLSNNKKSGIIDFKIPTAELVAKLNEINPILIGGYVSTFLILAEEANAGRLKINVKYMVPIGTSYTQHDRDIVSKAFNCTTFTTYSCTEAGEIGHECTNGHFHIVPDVIVEAVDDMMHPVPDGTESNCLLITNLWNKTQPFIRYRINDRCIIHNEPCGCKHHSKWIEVVGRESTKIEFTNSQNQKVYLTDFMFEDILDMICDDTTNYQFIISKNIVEIRANNPEINKNEIQIDKIKWLLNELAYKYKVTLNMVFSDELPIIADSGKNKRIIFM